jgi:hypothetical protein
LESDMAALWEVREVIDEDGCGWRWLEMAYRVSNRR